MEVGNLIQYINFNIAEPEAITAIKRVFSLNSYETGCGLNYEIVDTIS